MRFADEHLKDFQRLYKEGFGVEISISEALEKGTRLVRLCELLAKHEYRKRQKDYQTNKQNEYESSND